MRRNGSYPLDDNLTIAYSNPAMMRALLVGWIGTRLNNSTFIDFAEDQGNKILQLFQLNGANTLSEYNAPTYYGIDTWALGATLAYGPKNASMTKAAAIVLPELWRDLSQHWNAYLGNMVGPYDRAYTRDITMHSSVLSLCFWGLFGHDTLPQPPKSESDLLFDVAQGAAIALVTPTLRQHILNDVLDTFTKPFEGERFIKKEIYDDLTGTHKRTTTSWLTKTLMIGAQLLNETVNRGDQFVPAIVHWAGDPDHKPYPLNSFFSLYPSASSIHAVASANKLVVEYPNRTQEGSDVFTFALSNLPLGWTLEGNRVEGLEGLPCLDVEVDAPGLVKLDVVYGKSLRNHLFYNVSYVVPEGFVGMPRVELGLKYTC